MEIYNFGANSKDLLAPLQQIDKSKGIISFGKDNLYPQQLLNIYDEYSAIHKAIVDRKVLMMQGQGVNYTTPAVEQFFNNITRRTGITIEQILREQFFNIELFNGSYFEVNKNADTSEVMTITTLPFERVRQGYNSENPIEDYYMYSSDWVNYRKTENKPIRIEAYTKNSNMSSFRQALEVEIISANSGNFYPSPNYSAGLKWIQIDGEIANFHINSLENGFSAGYHINIIKPGMDQDTARALVNKIKRTLTGTDQAGKFMITVADDKENMSTIEPIELNTSDTRFELLKKQALDSILVAHQVTDPELFGVKVPGELGNSNPVNSLEIFNATYIKPRRKYVMDALNRIVKDSGIVGEIQIEDYQLNLTQINQDPGSFKIEYNKNK